MRMTVPGLEVMVFASGVVKLVYASSGAHLMRDLWFLQGNIAGWKKQEGEEIAAGDVLCEVETDKASPLLSCPHTLLNPSLQWQLAHVLSNLLVSLLSLLIPASHHELLCFDMAQTFAGNHGVGSPRRGLLGQDPDA